MVTVDNSVLNVNQDDTTVEDSQKLGSSVHFSLIHERGLGTGWDLNMCCGNEVKCRLRDYGGRGSPGQVKK